MSDDGPKIPRNPYPSDDEPTQRANLDELLARQAAAKAGASTDFVDDSALTDVTDIEELMNADKAAPASDVPRAVRRKRVQTVMGVAPPPVAAAMRPAAPTVPPAVEEPVVPPVAEAPQAAPPTVAVRAGTDTAPRAFKAVEPSIVAPVAPSADQTAPRRGLGAFSPPSPPASPRVPLATLLSVAALSAAIAAIVSIIVVLLFPGVRRGAGDEATAEDVIPARVAPRRTSDEDEAPQAPASKALLDRARNGESGALAELEGRPPTDRSLAESFALADGRAANKRAQLSELQKTLSSGEPDAQALKKLRDWADDADVARDALAAMAALPGSVGGDLIYDVWVGTPARTVATALAEELAQTRSLREKASPPLGVALELRLAKTCAEVGPLLERARKHGDRRMLPLLGRLTKRKGCGLENDAACAACILQHGPDITITASAVKGRKAPKF